MELSIFGIFSSNEKSNFTAVSSSLTLSKRSKSSGISSPSPWSLLLELLDIVTNSGDGLPEFFPSPLQWAKKSRKFFLLTVYAFSKTKKKENGKQKCKKAKKGNWGLLWQYKGSIPYRHSTEQLLFLLHNASPSNLIILFSFNVAK